MSWGRIVKIRPQLFDKGSYKGGRAMANYIPGLASGFDWSSMIGQLMELERRPITLMESEKDVVEARKSAWAEINTKLLSLKTAASALTSPDDFNLFTSRARVTGTTKSLDELLDIAVGSTASQGSYTIQIEDLAQAQKLGSKSFDSLYDALGIEGDILINGRTVAIASADSLSTVSGKINALNSGDNPAGVVASLFTAADGEYRLTLTSQNTGAEGIDIANASAFDILGELGFADSTSSIHNTITNGVQSSELSSSTQNIQSLLGLSTTQSGNVTIAGQSVAIDFSVDSLQTVRDKIDALVGVNASIVTNTDDDSTTYVLQIDGTQDLADSENILQTLGFMRQGNSEVQGVRGDTANTANGATMTDETLLVDIDGYGAWNTGDSIAISGTAHDGSAVSATFTINEDSTVDDLLSAIEAAYAGEVSASVNAQGVIVVEDNLAGESSLSLSLDTAGITNANFDFGAFASITVREREIVSGQDASLLIDGVGITRSTNQITDVIEGVTLDLKGQEDGAVVTLDIDRDYEGIKAKISDMVDKYNEVMNYINGQFAYDEDTGEAAPLFGDSALMSVKSNIRSVILSGVTGMDSSLDHLSLIGINIDRDGLLSINDSTLEGYLQTNYSDVVGLLVAQGSSTNSNISFVSSGRKTEAGSYEVEITQAAEQASTAGVGFTGSLNEDATMTITDDAGREAVIELGAGWNITSIVNAINSELAQEYNEILTGVNSYYADELQSAVITADTAWENLYDAAGVSAGLAVDDVIGFSGTTSNGQVVSGEYSISDTSTQTVGDLLDAIEEAFGDGYNAYIDDQGHIAIEDTDGGDSDLTLTLDTVKNLDFGALGVSQEGRYLMDIAASNEDGQLKISHNAYGDNSFTIGVAGGNLGMTDGEYTGVDVAGRIRDAGSATWMTMTGNGRVLTGDEDQDVEGLVIRYAGTATDIYDFEFTAGIGEQLDRALFYMTDAYEGYVADKQESLRNQMDRIDLKIENTEKRIAVKEEALIRKFSVMESLISQMQAQQQWLSGQINSLGTFGEQST
jgi:flagellar hook-associated protein 2